MGTKKDHVATHDTTNRRRYNLYMCHGCMREFMTTHEGGREAASSRYCPICGDDIDVAFIKKVKLDKLVIYKSPWDEREDYVLLKGREHGLTYREIARELENRSIPALKKRYARLKEVEKNFKK